MGCLLVADAHTFVCRTWEDLAARLVWARGQGYRTAKARRANGWMHRPPAATLLYTAAHR